MIKNLLAAFFISICLFSCASVKELNDYASQSLENLNNFEKLGYNFEEACMDRCLYEVIDAFEIQRTLDCNCPSSEEADSVSMHLFHAIFGYFDGLYQLSNNELTRYDLSRTQKELQEGTFGDLQIEADQVKAFGDVSQLMLRASTDRYRRSKIGSYISEANAPLQILLEKFRFVLEENLAGILEFHKERLFTYYRELNFSTNLSDYEKGQATFNYYQQLKEINQKQRLIHTMGKSMEKVAEGHQHLYATRSNLRNRENRLQLKKHTAEMQDLLSVFNKLKN